MTKSSTRKNETLCELPILAENRQASAASLIRAVKQSQVILARMTSQEVQVAASTAYLNADYAGVRVANFVTDIVCPSSMTPVQVIENAFEPFEKAQVKCLVLESASEDFPESLVSFIESRGFVATTKHVWLMHQFKSPEIAIQGLRIVPARAVYAKLKKFYQQAAREIFSDDETFVTTYASAMIDRLDESRLELFAAMYQGEIVGVAGVIALGQQGVVSPAWFLKSARGKGFAKAMMYNILDHCVRAQFEQVILTRSDGCDAIAFYESLGFVKRASYIRYVAK